ncbi:hypothetical protein B0H15DRAFT_863511 [Mycena belliarum]|uniref:Uncharacterized protein n=1 Tax=Mycena belliarum TaxID=1033014 RepID=A0AAD6TSI8_9AGAR|nr:hypothetical protein B0H15DRAFT_863511 [Mycena belliae]
MPIVPGTRDSYIGAFLENILYGAYLIVFTECCTLLWKKKTRGVKHMYLLGTTALMFLLITARCVIDTVRPILAFANDDLDFGPPNSPLGVATNLCWTLVTSVGDVFIVFRTFVVWDRTWWIVLVPSLLCAATTAFGFVVIATLVKVASDNSGISRALAALDTFIALSLATNVMCTGLIAVRLIRVRNRTSWQTSYPLGRSESMKVLSILVESAAIYTMLLIAMLIVNRVNPLAGFIFYDIAPPTIGLVFSYIIIRVSRGTSYGDGDTTAISLTNPTFERSYATNRTLGQSVCAPSAGEHEIGMQEVHMDGEARNDDANMHSAKWP